MIRLLLIPLSELAIQIVASFLTMFQVCMSQPRPQDLERTQFWQSTLGISRNGMMVSNAKLFHVPWGQEATKPRIIVA